MLGSSRNSVSASEAEAEVWQQRQEAAELLCMFVRNELVCRPAQLASLHSKTRIVAIYWLQLLVDYKQKQSLKMPLPSRFARFYGSGLTSQTARDRLVERLREQGIGHLRGRGKGDLYVRLIIQIPTKLSRKQRELIEEFEQTK